MFEKWASCKFSVRLMFPGDDGYATREQGYIDDHGCEHPMVIESSAKTSLFIGGGELMPVAILFGFGRRDDQDVVDALTRTCGDCRYFQTRQRVS